MQAYISWTQVILVGHKHRTSHESWTQVYICRTKGCSFCLFQVRQIRTVSHSLSVDAAKKLASAFISSHFDYCSSLPAGATSGLLTKLQFVQNAVARFVMISRKFDHYHARPTWPAQVACPLAHHICCTQVLLVGNKHSRGRESWTQVYIVGHKFYNYCLFQVRQLRTVMSFPLYGCCEDAGKCVHQQSTRLQQLPASRCNEFPALVRPECCRPIRHDVAEIRPYHARPAWPALFTCPPAHHICWTQVMLVGHKHSRGRENSIQ